MELVALFGFQSMKMKLLLREKKIIKCISININSDKVLST